MMSHAPTVDFDDWSDLRKDREAQNIVFRSMPDFWSDPGARLHQSTQEKIIDHL